MVVLFSLFPPEKEKKTEEIDEKREKKKHNV